MAGQIAGAYGEALFEIAVREKKEEIFGKEAQDILDILEEYPQLDCLIRHPGISLTDKEKLFLQLFDGRISKELTELMKLLAEKKREGYLGEILRDLIERIRQKEKCAFVFVTTATELTEEKKKAVKKRLLEVTGYRTMEIHYHTDPALIAGMIIRVGNRVVDNSIRTQLEEMKKQLLQTGQLPEAERYLES